MRTLYVEGPETHDGPESYVGAREDAGGALTGVHAGRAIEPRNADLGCRRCRRSGRQHRQQRHRKLPADPAGSENQGTRGVSLRDNREISYSPVRTITGRAAQERPRPHA